MTPQINDEINGETYSYRQPNLTYKLGESTVAGKITDKIESVKQAIYHILMTERYSTPIYDDDYGIELEQYLNKDFWFIQANISKTLNDALTQDDRITSVTVNNVTQTDFNSCIINFTVHTIYGDIEEETNVLQ